MLQTDILLEDLLSNQLDDLKLIVRESQELFKFAEIVFSVMQTFFRGLRVP